MLAPRPIGAGDLADRPFDLGKYYPPLANGFPNAARIFGHIVNVPCHAGMAAISKQTIVSVLRDLAERRPVTELAERRPPSLAQRVVGRLMGFGRSGT